MNRQKLFFIITLFLFFISPLFLQAQLPYLDPDTDLDERLSDLVSRMTLEEKIGQLHFDAPEIERLGIKPYGYWNEALHGVARWHEATVFPQVIGLGSTWNPDLIEKMGVAIGKEARVFNNQSGKGLTYFSPTINLARDPRWGRTEEVYGEDPYHTGRMGVAFVNGMQGRGESDYLLAGATVKHFVADNSEFHRTVASSYLDMRDLREYYFPAFEMAVKEANVASVMSTYRGLNGVPGPASVWLLDKVLRDEWGFGGYTVSDCWAVSVIVSSQFYVDESEKAVQLSLQAGTDLNCGDYYINHLQSALDMGYVTEYDIDRALKRVLRTRFLFGDFDPDDRVPWRSIPDEVLNSKEHQELATKIARESMVLLKNENNMLPLGKDNYSTIAVIGAKAEEPEYGAYTGFPNQAVTILQGIRHKTGAAQSAFEVIKAERLHKGSYMNKVIDYSTFERPVPDAIGRIHPVRIKSNDWMMFKNIDFGSGTNGVVVRAASKSAGGTISIRVGDLESEEISRVAIGNTGDNDHFISFEAPVKPTEGIHDVYLLFEGDEEVLFYLTTFEFIPEDNDWNPTNTDITISYERGCDVIVEDRSGFDDALRAAAESELVIFVYGTDLTVANEGRDPAVINVPAIQRELLQKIFEVNQNIVLVLAVGFPLVIDWELEHIPAILGAWFGGQAQGVAVADILFGDYNPGGKLPMTWYLSEEQLPPFHDYHIRKNNRTYMYFDGDVLFPFGYGLSYTTFEYGPLVTNLESYTDNDTIELSVDITNSGPMAGDEVAQVYFRQENASVKTPERKLIRFQRVFLKPGESKTVSFMIPVEELGFWDIKNNSFIVESDDFTLMTGSSSEDIRQSVVISVKGREYQQGIIRINAGGDYYVDSAGKEWMPDYGFDFGQHSMTSALIGQTDDPTVFQTSRKRCDPATIRMVEYPNAEFLYQWQLNTCEETDLYYNFEVLNGTYDIILYFAETEHRQAGARIFDVMVEGETLIEQLDVYTQAGFNNAMTVALEDVVVTDGYLNIEFIGSAGFPSVAGIEVLPAVGY